MNTYIILLLIIIVILLFANNYENFNQDFYKSYKIDKQLKRQEYLTFLDDTYNEFKTKTKNIDKLTDSVQKDILFPVYKKWDETTPKKLSYINKQNDKSIDCVGLSNYLCQFTDPNFYISSDKVYAPPPWLINSYKDIDYSKQTNLKCFNENLSCCKKSL